MSGRNGHVAIGEVVEKAAKWDPRATASNDEIDYIDIGAVNQETKLIDEVQRVSAHDAPSRARQLVEGNDILVSTVRPNLNAVAMVPKNLSGATASTGFCVLRPKLQSLDSRYLYCWVRSPAFIRRMVSRATGASYPAVSDAIVRESTIPLPPLSEQKRIAGILDKADAIRRKRQQAIGLTEQFLRSTFLDMFGDPVTNPKNWPTQQINSLCTLVRGSSPRPKADPRYYGGPVPRLMVADITRDGWLVTPQIDSLTEEGAKKSRPVPKGTIVMAVSGNVGLMSELAIDACVHDGFVAFTKLNTTAIEPKYLMLTLHFLKITHESRKAGAIFQNLTTHDIKALELPMPPLEEQRRYLRLFDRAKETETKLTGINEHVDNLFNSLVQRAFRGEL